VRVNTSHSFYFWLLSGSSFPYARSLCFIACLFCHCTILKKLLELSSIRMMCKVGNDESIWRWKWLQMILMCWLSIAQVNWEQGGHFRSNRFRVSQKCYWVNILQFSVQSFQEIMFVYACGNAIHLRKSFAVRTNVSGLCSFKFNSMAHPVFMLCQDGGRMYIVVAWQWHRSLQRMTLKVWIQKTIHIIFICQNS
jgi:hypothetical protein